MSDDVIVLLRWALMQLAYSLDNDLGLTLDAYYSGTTPDDAMYQQAKAAVGGDDENEFMFSASTEDWCRAMEAVIAAREA